MDIAGEITVLIVDDNAPKAHNLTKLLGFEQNIKVLETTSSGEEGIRRYADLRPDVVLMDTNLPDLDGIQVTEAILAQDPLAQILFSSLDPRDDTSERAIDAGAVGFLTMPIDPDRLVEKIRRVAERGRKLRQGTAPLPPGNEPRPKGKVIAVYGCRGGAGCTTLAVNLALLLQTADTPTALVDAHRQYGDAAVMLNASPRYALDDMASRDEPLESDTILELLTAHETGLGLVPSPASPELGELITDAGYGLVLDALQGHYVYTVIDCQPVLDDLTLTSLARADLVLVVLAPDVPSVKNAMQFLTTLERLSLEKARAMLVLNQADRRNGLKREDVARTLRHPVSLEVPFDREVVLDAINRGDPLMTAKKAHALSVPLRGLVITVRERLMAEGAETLTSASGSPRIGPHRRGFGVASRRVVR